MYALQSIMMMMCDEVAVTTTTRYRGLGDRSVLSTQGIPNQEFLWGRTEHLFELFPTKKKCEFN